MTSTSFSFPPEFSSNQQWPVHPNLNISSTRFSWKNGIGLTSHNPCHNPNPFIACEMQAFIMITKHAVRRFDSQSPTSTHIYGSARSPPIGSDNRCSMYEWEWVLCPSSVSQVSHSRGYLHRIRTTQRPPTLSWNTVWEVRFPTHTTRLCSRSTLRPGRSPPQRKVTTHMCKHEPKHSLEDETHWPSAQ